MVQRLLRINQLIKKEISQLILKEIDFGSNLVTVTQVETSPDLSQSKVAISVLPTENSESVLAVLGKNIYQLQQMLNKKLKLKKVPKLIFEIDQAEIKAKQVENTLTKIKKMI